MTARVDEDSYDRFETERRNKREQFKTLFFIQFIVLVVGVTVISVIARLHSLAPDTEGIGNAIGYALILTSATAWGVMMLIKRAAKLDNKGNNYRHQLAAHFMREMGIPSPAQELRNPEYLAAFDKVEKAAAMQLMRNRGPVPAYATTTALGDAQSFTIGSIVLRDKTSLGQAPYLIDLISNQGITDYDKLSKLVDKANGV